MTEVKFIQNGQLRKGVARVCQTCKADFITRLGGRWGKAKFCSRTCASKGRSIPKVPVKCANCHQEFLKSPKRMGSSKHSVYFCSRACKDVGQRIGGVSKIHPPHYNNGKMSYRTLFLRAGNTLTCSRCGYDEFSCSVEVHHLDEDRANSSVENLAALCANCHRALHSKLWTLT